MIEGRAHKYSANAIYRSIRTGTSIVASMGQIGHDSQEGCQAQAELNRYLCHLARHELRVSLIEGRTCSYSAHAIYSSTRPNTSIFADMGQGW